MTQQPNPSPPEDNTINFQVKWVLEQLKDLYSRAQADIAVSRERIKRVAEHGRELAANPDIWPGGPPQREEYLQTLDNMEKKINEFLDFKLMRAEGLIRVVSL